MQALVETTEYTVIMRL